MPYSPAELTPIDRMRGRIGDTAEPPQLRGGETRYQALLDALAGDEESAGRRAAAALAAQLAQEPDSISGGGESVSFRERIAQLNRIAQGLDRTGSTTSSAVAPAAGSGDVATQVVW